MTTDPRSILDLAANALRLAADVLHQAEVEAAGSKAPAAPPKVRAASMPWAYPQAARSMAVKLRDEGASWNEIRKALIETCGRAPTPGNLARHLPGWRKSTVVD